jgi:hypothetical protein
MSGPRDPIERFGVPVNYETGKPLTEAQQQRLERLTEAAEAFRNVMHEAEGSTVDSGWDFRTNRMRRAADHLEIALLMARKVACEVS